MKGLIVLKRLIAEIQSRCHQAVIWGAVAENVHTTRLRSLRIVIHPEPPAFAPAEPSLATRIFSFPAVLATLVVVFVFALARSGLADPDIWWHLRNAEYLLDASKWPRVDVHSYTVFGNSWVNPEWLGELPYYVAWRAFGLLGIKLLSILILELIFGGVLYLCWHKSGNIKASAVACYLAVLLGSVSFGPRILLFGYIYLLALLFLLEDFRLRGGGRLWLVPALFCAWINTHGSWAFGLIVLAIFIAGGLVGGTWGRVEATRWSAAELRWLGGCLAASIAALFANPYGYRLVLYPLDLAFHQKLNIAHVAEWSSVDFHNARGKIALLLLVTLLLAALFGRGHWQLYEMGLALLGVYAGITYVRFLFLAGILTAPLIANFLAFLPRYRPEVDRPAWNALIIAGAFTFMAWTFPTGKQLWQSVDREYPSEVLPSLSSLAASDHVLNYYLWGGYLGWRDPQFRDFIDSRVDIFEYAGVLKDYLDLLDLKDPFPILDKYHIRYVLFPPDELLTYALRHDARWKVVFSGQVSILFERVETPAGKAWDAACNPPSCAAGERPATSP